MWLLSSSLIHLLLLLLFVPRRSFIIVDSLLLLLDSPQIQQQQHIQQKFTTTTTTTTSSCYDDNNDTRRLLRRCIRRRKTTSLCLGCCCCRKKFASDSSSSEKNDDGGGYDDDDDYYRDYDTTTISSNRGLSSSSRKIKCRDIDQAQSCLCNPAPESFKILDDCIQQQQRLSSASAAPFNNNAVMKKTVVDIDIQQQQQQQQREDLEAVIGQVVKSGCYVGISINNNNDEASSTAGEWWIERKEIQQTTEFFLENSNNGASSSSSSSSSSILYIDSDMPASKMTTTLDLAHEALQLSIQSYKFGTNPDDNSVQQQIDDIVSRAIYRIKLLDGADLRGRISADVALNFALAGVTTTKSTLLFDLLYNIAYRELLRFGYRSQCKPTTICHMIEKFAAAGCCLTKTSNNNNNNNNNNSQQQGNSNNTRSSLQRLAYEILKDRGYNDLAKNFDDDFNFFSDMPLLWLWRFSAKQSKVNPSINTKATTQQQPSTPILQLAVDWHQLYKDPTRPLIIDLGSGMGVSLLGLATTTTTTTITSSTSSSSSFSPPPVAIDDIDWSVCNYLGVELNTSLVRFANSVASRWNISHKLQYVSIPAETIINFVHKTYPGQVKMVMIQFPTPYRLQQQPQQQSSSSSSRRPPVTTLRKIDNTEQQQQQLESVRMTNFNDRNNFMVTSKLLDGVSSVLLEERQKDIISITTKKDGGYLLLQSNSEDVAAYMKDLAENLKSFSSISVPSPVLTENDMTGNITWRTKRMLQQRISDDNDKNEEDYQQNRRRAMGPEWNKESILPSRARSETEVSCLYNGTPIHRCILRRK